MSDSMIGTVTVMFTDLVGSTALHARVGEDAAGVLRSIHDEILTEAVAGNSGRVVKHLGDRLMATFAADQAILEALRPLTRRGEGEQARQTTRRIEADY